MSFYGGCDGLWNLFTNGQGGQFGDWWSLAFVLLYLSIKSTIGNAILSAGLGKLGRFISCAECKLDRLRTKLVHVVVALHVG